MGCSPWGCWESDMTEWLQFPFSLSCIGEGNGNPLQCSCLENPRDGGAWWATVYAVTQSWTRLKRLSSSSSSPGLACLHLEMYNFVRRSISRIQWLAILFGLEYYWGLLGVGKVREEGSSGLNPSKSTVYLPFCKISISLLILCGRKNWTVTNSVHTLSISCLFTSHPRL